MEDEIVSAMVFDHSGTDVIVYCDSPIIDVTVSWMMSHIYDSCLILYLYKFGNCLTREFILAFFDSILDHFNGSPQSKNSKIYFYLTFSAILWQKEKRLEQRANVFR